MIRAIWRHWRGVGPDWRQRAKEARLVAEIAEQLDAGNDESQGLRQG
jgi:hypothetical protein